MSRTLIRDFGTAAEGAAAADTLPQHDGASGPLRIRPAQKDSLPENAAHTDTLPKHAAHADSLSENAARRDSLPMNAVHLHAETDSLPAGESPDTLFFAGGRPATAAADTAQHYRPVAAGEIFGSASVVVTPPAAPHAARCMPTDAPAFQCLVLLLAAAYARLLYHNLGEVRRLLSRISRNTAGNNRLSEERNGVTPFQRIAAAIGLFIAGAIIVRYVEPLHALPFVAALPRSGTLLLSLGATLICAVAALGQSAALHAAAAVTRSQPLVAQLQLLRRTYFSIAVVVVFPALLLLMLCPPAKEGVWFVAATAGLAGTVLLYLRETLQLFLSKKISILHWFLYLCIVEIFPVSLLWLLAVR